MYDIPRPTPPPLPPGPVPMSWGWADHADERARRRHHRLAVLHDARPECCQPGEVDPWGSLIAEFGQPDPLTYGLHFDHFLTPEGELATIDTGRFEVEDPEAFATWADEVFVRTGQAWAYVIEVDGAPWTRALFWFNGDGQLVLQAASSSRYAHLSLVFERIWPPVHRLGRSSGALRPDELGREPFDGWPPTEASVHTRLTFRRGTGSDPGAPPALHSDLDERGEDPT